MGRLLLIAGGGNREEMSWSFYWIPTFPKHLYTQGWTAGSSYISEGKVKKMLQEINPGKKWVEKVCMESWKPAQLAGMRKQRRKIRPECKGRAQWDWSHLKLLLQPCVYNQDNGRNPLLFVTLRIIQCLVEELLTVLLPRD